VTVLEDSGGGIRPEDDPDLSPGIGAAAQELERQLRTAHQLLEQTGGTSSAFFSLRIIS
jgi:hypothetical protein